MDTSDAGSVASAGTISANRRKSILKKRIQDANDDSIKVICRFRPKRPNGNSGRPQLATSKSNYSPSVNPSKDPSNDTAFLIREDDAEIHFLEDGGYSGKTYKFDKVFGYDSKQVDIYETVSGTVDSIMVRIKPYR